MTPARPVRRALTLGGLTALSTVGVVALPGGRTLDNLWQLLAYLVPFVFATETIAALQPAWFARWRLAELAGVASFAVVFCVFVPKMFDRVLANDFDGFYSLMRILAPLLILIIVLPYRLFGARPAVVRRVAYASMLLMLSGIEDLLFWVWRGEPVPARWDWADHITVVLGHEASRTEAYLFIAVDLLAAVAVLVWPTRAGARLSEPHAEPPLAVRSE
jgi:hypothetical protein